MEGLGREGCPFRTVLRGLGSCRRSQDRLMRALKEGKTNSFTRCAQTCQRLLLFMQRFIPRSPCVVSLKFRKIGNGFGQLVRCLLDGYLVIVKIQRTDVDS